MAKRRAEDSLLFETSSKKPCRLHHAADTVLENVSAGVGVCLSPVSLPDGCCRKRRYHSTEPERKHETAGFRVADKRKNDAVEEEEVLTVSGKYENSSLTSSDRKRPHEEPLDLNTLIPEATKVSDGDTTADDGVYNSFQFWRAPLPELDPALLEELGTECDAERRTKVKNSSSDAMET